MQGLIAIAARRLTPPGFERAMVRRRLPQPPPSRLAIWARRLAIFSLPVAALAIIIERAGLLDFRPVLATFAAALALAAIAILLAIAALVVIWIDGRDGARYALAALAIGALMLAYPAYLGVKAYQLPAINDITTDPHDPPRFEAVARLRTREANPVAYRGPAVYERQRAAYPDIAPLAANVDAKTAYEAAYAVVSQRKWRIVDARPPQAGRRDGRIEAIVRTPIMGFRDDVVIRIRTVETGVRVDVRSASRYGNHDLGTNAARVSSLIEDLDEAMTPDKGEQPARKAQRAAKSLPPAQPARR